MGPESETNLVSDNQSTYSTQCGCCSQLEFDFKARPHADCSGRGDSLSVSLVVTVGRPPPAGGHRGLGPDFSECCLLPGLPAGVVSAQGSSPQAGCSVSPGLGLLSCSPGAGEGKRALTSLFVKCPQHTLWENLPGAGAVPSNALEPCPPGALSEWRWVQDQSQA